MLKVSTNRVMKPRLTASRVWPRLRRSSTRFTIRSLRTVPDGCGFCTVAEQQSECVEQDGFAGARFPGQRRQARAQFDFQFIDDGEVSDVQG